MRLLGGGVDGLLAEASSCMEEAFPPEERVEAERLLSFSNEDPERSFFLAYLIGDAFAGLAFHAVLPPMAGDVEGVKRRYIAYLAVRRDLRGGGIGAAILRDITASDPAAKWFLSAERPDDARPDAALRRRRIAFYERNGWVDTGCHASDGGVDYELLTTSPPAGREVARHIARAFWGRLVAS